jgi:hypothetical protein
MGGTRTSILEILRNANSSVSVLRSSRPAHHRKTSQIATPRHWQLCWRRDSCEPAISSSERPTGARSAQHAASNLDNRHVEIVCAALAQVNVSVFYQFVDTANRAWPTSVAPRRGFSRSSRTGLGRSQKDGLPSGRGERLFITVQGHQLGTGEGQPGRCPFLIGSAGDVITRTLLKASRTIPIMGGPRIEALEKQRRAAPSLRTSMKHGLVGLVLI